MLRAPCKSVFGWSLAAALASTACAGADMEPYLPTAQKTKFAPDTLFAASTKALEDKGYVTTNADPERYSVETREKETAVSSVPRLSYKYSWKIVTAGGTLAITSRCTQNSSMAREKFEDCGDERPKRLRDEQEELRSEILERAKRNALSLMSAIRVANALWLAVGLSFVGSSARAQTPETEPPATEPPVVPEDPVPSPEAPAPTGVPAPAGGGTAGRRSRGLSRSRAARQHRRARPRDATVGLDAPDRRSTELRGARAGHRACCSRTSLSATSIRLTGEVETGRADQLGIGGGLGFRAGMMYVSLPDPASPSGALTGFRLGVGLDGSVLYSKPPHGFTYRGDSENVTGRSVDRVDKAFFYPSASVQLGFHVGFGKYRTPSIWRGMVFGLAYSPAYVWSLEIGKTEFDARGFNYGGFEATLDVVSMEAGLDNLASEMQIRLFALVLPKVNDDLPWLISLGVGAVWY